MEEGHPVCWILKDTVFSKNNASILIPVFAFVKPLRAIQAKK
jgi:hypothetical protein